MGKASQNKFLQLNQVFNFISTHVSEAVCNCAKAAGSFSKNY